MENTTMETALAKWSKGPLSREERVLSCLIDSQREHLQGNVEMAMYWVRKAQSILLDIK